MSVSRFPVPVIPDSTTAAPGSSRPVPVGAVAVVGGAVDQWTFRPRVRCGGVRLRGPGLNNLNPNPTAGGAAIAFKRVAGTIYMVVRILGPSYALAGIHESRPRAG